MGGNVVVKSLEGVEFKAETIDIKQVDIISIRTKLIKLFEVINQEFEKRYGNYLWEDFEKLIVGGMAFSGSSKFLFDKKSMTYDDLLKYKSSFGDIDIMVTRYYKNKLWKMLKNFHDIKIPFVKYIGNNKRELLKSHQINSIFVIYEDEEAKSIPLINVQIDFEFVPYKDGLPTEFALFSHSSTKEDIILGLKGVHHKLLMRAITSATSRITDGIVMTPKATPFNPRKKKLHMIPSLNKFSVAKGLRKGCKIIDENGTEWGYPEHLIYKEIEIDDSIYIKSLKNIFKIMFKTTDEDISDMGSFIGLIENMKKYLEIDEIHYVHQKLLELYWGNGAQGLVRNNSDRDLEIKNIGYQYFLKAFPYCKTPISEMITKYYDNYRMTDVLE